MTEHNDRRPDTSNALVPANMGEALHLAEMMATSELLPEHLRGKQAECFLVIEQSTRWKMSPFAVAPCTSVIKGKLMYEGKLVAAAVNNSGLLSKRLNSSYTGSGDGRTVTVFATIRGESEPREVQLTLGAAATDNGMWKSQPDQQLFYAGARVWARRHAPEVMLGVYSPEEFDEPQAQSTPVERNVTPNREQPAALPYYPDDNFNKNFDTWAQAIAEKRATPEKIIAKIRSLGQLTDEQEERIRACKPTTENAEA